VHQAFVPGRSPEVLDFLVDFMGSAAGAGVFVALARRRALKRKARQSRPAALPVAGAARAQE
jgi:VanZ family protein